MHDKPKTGPDMDDMSLGDSRAVTVAAGRHLFRQGDPASALYYVEKGCIRLERHSTSGTRMVVHTARAGELLAEAALVADTYHCDAVAVKDSRLRLYDKKVLLGQLSAGSQEHKLLFVLARQLLKARQRIELRNVRSAEERVMLFLEQNADSAGNVPLRDELQDLAGELGLSREAFYRTLAKLEKERRIRRSPERISVIRR
jgi:CRP-like cAMP-binding protein